MPTPRFILQETLDDLGSAVMTDDWEGFCARIVIPFELETEAARIKVVSLDEMREGYDTFRDMIVARRVSDYVRLVEHATFDGPDTICGTYVSHLLGNGVRVVPPYRSMMILQRQGNRWSVRRIANSWKNDRWPILTPRPTDERSRDA